MKFVGADGEFDVDAYRFAAKVTITAQEILVDNASYPTPKIEENSHKFRPLGLGYANLGALLMSRGLAYDSDEGRNYAAALTAIMHGEAYKQSSIVARDHGGPFFSYDENREPFLRVINKHRDAAYQIPADQAVPKDMIAAARSVYDEALELGEQYGYRNAQVTVLAPTGTIAFMMDCDTTGVEPDIALIKYKKLVGEGFLKIVNQTVPAALRKLGYGAEEVDEILAYLTDHETIEGAPHLKPQHLPVFDCAFKPANGERSIHYMGHVRMMGAIQPFISGAISKTVNMPEAATAEEIEKVYLEGWKLGLKAIAVYRDNSKRSQPLSTGKKKDGDAADIEASSEEVEKLRKQLAKAQAEAALPHRRRLPAERSAVTHKFDISGHEGYITVGLYPDGQPGEIFLKMAKEGSTVSGLMDSFATTVSVALQYGVPLKDLVNKFAHVRFEPSGFTGNQEIPIAKSIIDYIFRWLGSRFLSPDDKANLGLIDRTAVVADVPVSSPGSATVDSAETASAVADPAPTPASPPPASVAPEPATDTPKATAVAAEPVVAKAAEPAAEPLAVIATNGALAALQTVTPTATGTARPRTATVAAAARSPSTSVPAPRSASRPRPTPPAAWTAARSWSATGPATSASTAGAPAAAASNSRARGPREWGTAPVPARLTVALQAGQRASRKTRRTPGNPFNSCSPASSRPIPEPSSSSRVVDETMTSSAPPSDITRAAVWTARPRASSPTNSTSPVWMPTRIGNSMAREVVAIAAAHWAARTGRSKTASRPSPVVLISRPRYEFRWSRRRALWITSRSRQAWSPIRRSVAVESTMSVNRIVTMTPSPTPSGASPHVRALVQSMVTNGSSPTTQASCPGGIS